MTTSSERKFNKLSSDINTIPVANISPKLCKFEYMTSRKYYSEKTAIKVLHEYLTDLTTNWHHVES